MVGAPEGSRKPVTRYLITGASGMLGHDLGRALEGREVTSLSRAELDVTDAAAVAEAVRGHDAVINAAAWTRVDDAETRESEALAVNGHGAGNVAEAARAAGARLVQLSTDYVFDGQGTSPYPEGHPIAPLGAYGRTKAEGERRVLAAHPEGTLIVRTAWLYGAGGPNFARTILAAAAERDTVSVVTDQIGQPTWSADLAAALVALLDADAPAGVYHATNAGRASWFDFAQAVFRVAGLDEGRVLPTDSAAFPRPAARPAYSVLGNDALKRARIPPLRPWQDALRAAWDAGW